MKKTLLLLALLISALLTTSCMTDQTANNDMGFPPITETKTREITFVIDGESQTETFGADEEIGRAHV